LCVAVLVDATVIRTFVVPAAMALGGRFNWYPGARRRGFAAAGQHAAQVAQRREHLVVPIRALRVVGPLLVFHDFLVLAEDVFGEPTTNGHTAWMMPGTRGFFTDR
jgi:hypothetical protein